MIENCKVNDCHKRELQGEIERLRAAVEDAVETLEAMNLHADNPLYDRLRSVLESNAT